MQILDSILNKVLGKYLDDYIKKNLKKQLLNNYLVFGEESRLKIAKTAVVNNALFNLSSGNIVIDDYAFFGHNVSLLTGTHNYYRFGLERQTSFPKAGRDIHVKEGVWIASNATIIAPCIIGEHSVIAAASLVSKDVLPYSVVAGTPAKTIKFIE